jgi:hypothetical protein
MQAKKNPPDSSSSSSSSSTIALTACRAVPTMNKGEANDKGKGGGGRGVKRKFIVEVPPIGASMQEWYEDYLIAIEVPPIGASMQEWYEDYLISIDPS